MGEGKVIDINSPVQQEEAPAEGNTAEQKHGICPHCGAERKGLVFDFFSNMMQVAGSVCQVSYSMCSCQQCGKIISTSIMNIQETAVQPASSRLSGGWPSSHRRH